VAIGLGRLDVPVAFLDRLHRFQVGQRRSSVRMGPAAVSSPRSGQRLTIAKQVRL
jgi:hypothetical protein